jgi:dienelactone hydrolase
MAFSVVLTASMAWPAPADIYKAASGPLKVNVANPVVLPMKGKDRNLELRVGYPAEGGPFPIIVLSHGTFSNKDKYALVADHWTSHGYVVILPNHIDSKGRSTVRSNAGMREIIHTRAADMSFILDSLDEIESKVPNLKGKLDQERLVAAGHSVGSYVALLACGLKVKNPQDGSVMSHNENRFKAVVMLSDPGKMALMPDSTWAGVTVPTFLSTGTKDYGLMGDGRRSTPFEMKILSGSGAPVGTKHSLVIQGGDHYFGGLIHKDNVPGKPDHEGLTIFNGASTAFLDTYLKSDQKAHEFLTKQDVKALTGDRASLQIK